MFYASFLVAITIFIFLFGLFLSKTENGRVLAAAYSGNPTFNDCDCSSQSFAHDAGSGSNRLLVVTVILSDEAADKDVSAISYGGTNMFSNKHVDYAGGQGAGRIQVFYLSNPPSGSNTVSLTLDSSNKVTTVVSNITGVDTTSPLDTALTAGGKASSHTHNVTGDSGDLGFHAFASKANGGHSTNQTQRWNREVGGTGTSGQYTLGGTAISTGSSLTMTGSWNGNKEYTHIAFNINKAPPDPSWATGAADFEIWESSSLIWDNGTLVCSATITDNNASTVDCLSGQIKANTQHRIQAVLKDLGGAVSMNGASDYVDHIAVKGGFAGTSPTLGSCAFYDADSDDGSTTCASAWNATNNVRITNTGAGNVVIADTTGTEGFMYLITTDSDVPITNSTSYMNTSIDGNSEDSSKITINGLSGGSYSDLGIYESEPKNLSSSRTFSIIEWTESVSGFCPSCEIKIQIKTANDSGGSPGTWSTTWCGPLGENGDEIDFFTNPSGEVIHSDHNGDQWIKYLATLSKDAGTEETPVLEDIRIYYK